MDDEASIRDLLSKTLALAEYDVDVAPDGRSALERMRMYPYDLLIDKITGVIFYSQAIALMLIPNRRISIALLAFWLIQYPESAIYSLMTHCGGSAVCS